jgi:polar amino acid transport system substrate-binding protein
VKAWVLLAAVALAFFAGCGTTNDDATKRSLGALARPGTTVPLPTTTTTTARCDPTPSLRPDAPLPPPGQMPAGTAMARIYAEGNLVVGVDENTEGFAARNTHTGEIEGFEIDLVREIARAIFGDPSRIVVRTVVTSQKNQVVRDGLVDLTASADTMTCARRQVVAFSSEYYTAHHELLVRNDAKIHGRADLAGLNVCVTKGSTSVVLLQEIAPKAHPYPVTTRTDCLVALQQARADAYLGHDTFIRGLHQQDPLTTTILPEVLETQHYGIAIARSRPELVRFVNALLERMREDDTLKNLARKWLGSDAAPIPAPAYQD